MSRLKDKYQVLSNKAADTKLVPECPEKPEPSMAKRWKRPKCPSVDNQINKMWHSQDLEYYAAINRSEALLHTIYNVDVAQNIVK